MRLSRETRWVLSNQYRILSHLAPKDRDFYERAAGVIERGFEGEYESIAAHVYDDGDTLSEGECGFVTDVLAMYDALQRSVKETPVDGVDATRLAFPGFDGNNETKYMAYAGYVVARGHFAHVQGTDYMNSHSPSLDTYHRMLEGWKRAGRDYQLTPDQVREILAERVHPTNR
jgi:uncharacterized protein YfbU (UPF0304 family)